MIIRTLACGVTLVPYWCLVTETPEIRVTLRLPPDLHAALQALARRDDRSLNRQIVALLRQAVMPPVDADAYRDSRRSLSSMPRYTFPKPTMRRPRGGG